MTSAVRKDSAAGLKWTPVECEDSAFLGDLKGFISLEEIDGVDVEYADTITGAKIVRFKSISDTKTVETPSHLAKFKIPKRQPQLDTQSVKKKAKTEKKTLPVAINTPFVNHHGWTVADSDALHVKCNDRHDTTSLPMQPSSALLIKNNAINSKKESKTAAVATPLQSVDISAWKDLQLHASLLENLSKAGFSNPTPIQRAVLPVALQNRDVVAAAQTGSGKTLAFGLSIAQYLLSHPDEMNHPQRPLLSLIISPTRELALQIRDHIARITINTPIMITAIVGGLAKEKQERLLLRRPHIVVGTPGRLYELISQETSFLKDLSGIRCFVIDEADRMIQQGHFKELQSIMALLPLMHSSKPNTSSRDMDTAQVPSTIATSRQTMLFSATLTLNDKLPNSKLPSMQNLLRKIDFKDKVPTIIDLTSTMLAKGITESQLHCLQQDKDEYLYYFLLRYPGRTLVFLNSIDAIRRLLPLLRLLQMPVHPLHAQLQQKQRLKNMERFRITENVVLLATDVAARGLDIDNIQHIVHFQVPKNVDTYIHRSGRTARGRNESGMSLLLVGPEEVVSYRKLLYGLGKDKMPEFPLASDHMKQIKERVTLARRIDLEEHRVRKNKSDGDWLKKAAEAMEIDQDDNESDKDDDDNNNSRKSKQSVDLMKATLEGLLKRHIMPRGTSLKYPASHPTNDLPARLKATQNGGLLAVDAAVPKKALDVIVKKYRTPRK